MKRTTRLVSLLVAACMALSLFPVSAFASADYTRGGVDSPTPQAAVDDSTVDINGKTGKLTIKATDTGYTVTWDDGTPTTVTAPSITITGTAQLGQKDSSNLYKSIALQLSVDGTDAAAYITLDNVSIHNANTGGYQGSLGMPGMAVKGDVTLTLDGENLLAGGTGTAGIQKMDDSQLTIQGSGTLNASGGRDGAGIGGGNSRFFTNGSHITIESGTITATGGYYSAGIGGGKNGTGEYITINGGNVTAEGSGYGAGIGGGYYGSCHDITIANGAVVNVTGGNGAPGIGSGRYSGDCSNVKILAGTDVYIVSPTNITPAIGCGSDSSGSVSNITIDKAANVALCQTSTVPGTVSVPYIGNKSGTDLTAEAVKGLTTGHIYLVTLSDITTLPTREPAFAYPVYGITVNGKEVDSHNAKYGILGYIANKINSPAAAMTYDLTTKTLTGNGKFENDLTITAADNALKCDNENLTGKLNVDLTNTYKRNGKNTMGKLTVTDAAKVTVKDGNDSYKVTLDGTNITPADQPQPYVYTRDAGDADTHTLVVEPAALYGLTVENGAAYGDAAHTESRKVTKNQTAEDAVVYLKAIAPADGENYKYKFKGWTTTSAGGDVDFANANQTDTSFVMPARTVAVKADYARTYPVTVDGQPLKDADGNPLYFEAGETVSISSNRKTADSGEDAVFGGWATTTEGVTFEDATSPSTSFEMPAAPVNITSVTKYKLTVTGGTAYTDAETEPKTGLYAKQGELIHLAANDDAPYPGAAGSTSEVQFVSWKTDSDLTIEGTAADKVDGSAQRSLTFAMPASAVSLSTVTQATPSRFDTDPAYRAQLQLPGNVTFNAGVTPASMKADGKTGSVLFAKKNETVELHFDADALPPRWTFGQWVVTPLLPGAAAVTVTNATGTDASFTMPAGPVTVTFTVNEPVPQHTLNVAQGKAYADPACTAEIANGSLVDVGTTVYLKGNAPAEDVPYRFKGWTVPEGQTSPITLNAESTSFTMPAYNVDLTAAYARVYTVTVDGEPLRDTSGAPKYFEEGDRVDISTALPTEDTGADEVFNRWEGNVNFDDSDNTSTSFTMPDSTVNITAGKKYKITVTGGKKYDDTAVNEDGVYTYYAKQDETVQLEFANANATGWLWDSTQLPGGVTRAEGDTPAHFTMPGNAVTIGTSATGIIVPQSAYRVQVQLPEDVTFEEGADPVTVSVPDPAGTADDPKPDRTGSTAIAAEKDQTVSLHFDAAALPEGYTFGQWVVTQLVPETATVAVENASSMTGATFTMPASPVTVTFTVNAPVEPEPEPEPSDDGSSAVIRTIAAGGAATVGYLMGTRIWLESLYGFLPGNRIELATALWNHAGCPAPASTERYPDISENDTDAQQAARWCVEQGLMKGFARKNDDGTETVDFKPYGYVFRPQAIGTWYQLEKLLNEQAG